MKIKCSNFQKGEKLACNFQVKIKWYLEQIPSKDIFICVICYSWLCLLLKIKQGKREMAQERRSAKEMWNSFTFVSPPCPICIFRSHSSSLLCSNVISFLPCLRDSSNMTKCSHVSIRWKKFPEGFLKDSSSDFTVLIRVARSLGPSLCWLWILVQQSFIYIAVCFTLHRPNHSQCHW